LKLIRGKGKKMNIYFKNITHFVKTNLLVVLIVAINLVSCTTDPDSPGVEFMPDMYRATGYEAYLKKFDIDSADFFKRNLDKLGYEEAADSVKFTLVSEVQELYNVFNGGLITRKPVKGSIPEGKKPFTIEKGDRSLAKVVKMPIPYTETSLVEGKTYYEVFCVHCHGPKGQGKGSLIVKELFLKPPAYNSSQTKKLTPGEIYYTIFYGKGMMGSHASQIVEEKRWKIVQYVQTLQGKKIEDLKANKLKNIDSSVSMKIEDDMQ
jgi:cytochrome c553